MNFIQPKTLSGFMELLPKEQILFNQLKDVIKSNFEKFGFLPLDTPVIESSEILLAKAGGETEKQIYNVVNGDNNQEKKLSMRYDLTVPLAKYVALYFDKLTFPFKRYQIAKVYRGERPQKGRFREFYQCDIDIVGNENLSILFDAEIPCIMYNIFKELNIGDFSININNRKIMKGLTQVLGIEDKTADVLRTLDKIDKIGRQKVETILIDDCLISKKNVEQLINFISIEGSVDEKLQKLENLYENDLFNLGVNELKIVVQNMKKNAISENNFEINLSITRGLDYYTGTVYETYLKENKSLGSVCSGGRYDNLAEFYTAKKLPGVGMSIGLTRLFDLILKNNLLEINTNSVTKVLIIPMSEKIDECLTLATALRKENVNTEVFVENTKFKNKLSYANKLAIPYVVIVGEDEINGQYYTLKNMSTSEQKQFNFDELISFLAK